MASFDLSTYSDVATRIDEFVGDFPRGTIQTFIRHLEGAEVIFEARVFETPEDVTKGIYTSGFAREIEGKSNVNKTSHLENCETSAIGRALANKGYGTDKERASRSEMIKVARMNKEWGAMLDFIRDSFPSLTDEMKGTINGEEVVLKDWLQSDAAVPLKEQFLLCRTVVEVLEATTGVKFGSDSPDY